MRQTTTTPWLENYYTRPQEAEPSKSSRPRANHTDGPLLETVRWNFPLICNFLMDFVNTSPGNLFTLYYDVIHNINSPPSTVGISSFHLTQPAFRWTGTTFVVYQMASVLASMVPTWATTCLTGRATDIASTSFVSLPSHRSKFLS